MIEEPVDENLNQADECIECQADLLAEELPVFAVDAERYLCAHCAARRGGKFDELEQIWRPAPRVDDLL